MVSNKSIITFPKTNSNIITPKEQQSTENVDYFPIKISGAIKSKSIEFIFYVSSYSTELAKSDILAYP